MKSCRTTPYREHKRGLRQPWYGCNIVFCEMGRERYKCCKTMEGEPGCVQVHSCCQERVKRGKDDLLTGTACFDKTKDRDRWGPGNATITKPSRTIPILMYSSYAT